MSSAIPETIREDGDLTGRFKIGLAQALAKCFGESDWKRVAVRAELQDRILGHPRFIRSLSWGDDDHEGHVIDLIDELYYSRPSLVAALFEEPGVQDWFEKNDPGVVEAWRGENDPLVEALAVTVSEMTEAAGAVPLEPYRQRIQAALPNDPALAIGATKEMIETVMKTILAQRGMNGLDALNFPDLMNRSLSELGLKSVQPPTSDIEKNLRQIASGAQKILDAANSLRNVAGTGHGRVAGSEHEIPLSDAQFVSALGFVVAAWLLRHHHANR